MSLHDTAAPSDVDRLPPETPATLLPSPIAGVVSLVTRSSSLYLRVGSFIGGLALDSARVTTLTGLDLSRALIEGILTRAGGDVAIRARGELGRSDAEGLLERSIGTLHSTINSVSFAASTGFHLSSASLSTATDISQHLLATLDSILGSTDSSRAIASIITLIRREFQNPATGVQGEKVSVKDLLFGLCGLALLQKWSRRMIILEAREKEYEQTVWDVVILDDGRRADVRGSGDQDDHGGHGNKSTRSRPDRPVSFVSIAGDEEIFETVQREEANNSDAVESWPEADFVEHIMEGLPPNASVSVETLTTTTKTITVEVTGATPVDIPLPPDVEILEEKSQLVDQDDIGSDELSSEQKIGLLIPRYRVVYRAIRYKTRSTDIKAGSEAKMEPSVIKNEDHAPEGKDSSSENSQACEVFSLPGSPQPEEQIYDHGGEGVIDQLKDSSHGKLAKPDARSSATSPKPQDVKKHSAIPISISGEVASLQIGNSANQKRPRKPMSSSSSATSVDELPSKTSATGKLSLPKKTKSESTGKRVESVPLRKPEKGAALKNVLKRGSGTTSAALRNKELPKIPDAQSPVQAKTARQKPPWGGSSKATNRSTQPSLLSSARYLSAPPREAPRMPQEGSLNFFSSRDLGVAPDSMRSSSRASYYSIHERRRDSMVSQTDTYSVHSREQATPCSPATTRTSSRAQCVERNVSPVPVLPPAKVHRRSKSHVPSSYILKGSSVTSLISTSTPSRSIFQDSMAIQSLARDGFIEGMFPRDHLVRNVTRFIRFASASYGSHFLRIMGISSSQSKGQQDLSNLHHQEHHSFLNHTQLPADAILISSFVDPQGGTDATGHTNTGVPMVHYVSLDHESRAVVLTCRGTLGFEDVLTDMTCDYDELLWRGKAYKVHKGIHASARRLLEGGGGRVMATIKFALEEFPDYGLVLTGHSLGGAVTALLGIMISEPQDGSAAFITSSTYQKSHLLLTSAEHPAGTAPSVPLRLPSGRPVHVYAYGPPSTISPSLRLATRGLITTVVNGQDLVPYLSLGILHDLQAVALAFKTDDSNAKGELRQRLWSGITSGFTDRWYGGRAGYGPSEEEEDRWAYATLKTLRATMLSSKLVPPGEVFLVETQPVLQRNAFTTSRDSSVPEGLGRPATRATLRYVRDVQTRFGELRFGGSMLLDHSPGRYEASLSSLRKGVLE